VSWFRDWSLEVTRRGSHNGQDLSNTLWALAKLQLGPSVLGEDFFCVWAGLCKQQMLLLNAQALANSLWAIGSLEVGPLVGGPEFVMEWTKAAERRLPDFSAQHLANTIWALARLGLGHAALGTAFFTQWAAASTRVFADFSVQGWHNTLWAVASLKLETDVLGGELFCSHLLRTLAGAPQLLESFQPQHLSNCAWALTKLLAGCEVKGEDVLLFFKRFATISGAKFPDFKAADLVSTLFSLATLELGPAKLGAALFMAWSRAAHPFLSTMTAVELVNVLYAAGRLDLTESILVGGFWRSWSAASSKRLNDFTEQAVPSTVWGLAMVKSLKPPSGLDVLRDWSKVNRMRLSTFSSQELANSVWNTAAALYPPQAASTQQVGLPQGDSPLLPGLSPSQLATIIYSLSDLRLGYEELDGNFFQSWVVACNEQLEGMTAQGLANTIHGIARMHLQHADLLVPGFFSRWGNAAVSKLGSFSADQLSMTIGALARMELGPATLGAALFSGWAESSTRLVARGFSPGQLVNTVLALGSLELTSSEVGAELLALLCDGCVHKLGWFSAAHLAFVVYGFALLECNGSRDARVPELVRMAAVLLRSSQPCLDPHTAHKAALGAQWFGLKLWPPSVVPIVKGGNAATLITQVAKLLPARWSVRRDYWLQLLSMEVDLFVEQFKTLVFVDEPRRLTASGSLKMHHKFQTLLAQKHGFRVVRLHHEQLSRAAISALVRDIEPLPQAL
jgi:hypothetical protein